MIDNIFVMFGEYGFQYTAGIPVGTNCTSQTFSFILVEPIAFRDFQEMRIEAKDPLLNFTFPHIDDVLLLNNSRFDDYDDDIYTIEFEIKDTII